MVSADPAKLATNLTVLGETLLSYPREFLHSLFLSISHKWVVYSKRCETINISSLQHTQWFTWMKDNLYNEFNTIIQKGLEMFSDGKHESPDKQNTLQIFLLFVEYLYV